MTALPVPPGRLLTATDYVELGEDDRYRTELQEGSLVITPSPTPRHMIASGALFMQLEPQVPDGLRVIQDVDIDLHLVPGDQAGSSRRPDLVVVGEAAVDRVERAGGLLRADETILIIEIVSPSSRRTDHVIKRAEYADAGIPRYWIVDLGSPVSLLACHLEAGFGYRDAGTITGVFTTNDPFATRVDLNALA